jgi:hypothetical protein
MPRRLSANGSAPFQPHPGWTSAAGC